MFWYNGTWVYDFVVIFRWVRYGVGGFQVFFLFIEHV